MEDFRFAIEVTTNGQNSSFLRNWVDNGVNSFLIRFDTAQKTTKEEIGKNGIIMRNVGWGGPELVVKGDEHYISHNTVPRARLYQDILNHRST